LLSLSQSALLRVDRGLDERQNRRLDSFGYLTPNSGIPAPACVDTKEWDFEVERLSGRILWDSDYEDGHLYLDQSPEKSQWLKYMTRIPDYYFMAIADDLTDKEAQARIKELKKLCDSIITI
jgi:hypothetical protein